MRNARVLRVEKALQEDNGIVLTHEELQNPENHFRAKPLAYFESLGLTKADLKYMERNGLALRLRTYNGQLEFPKIKDKNGVEREFTLRNFQGGSRIKWILLAPQAAPKAVA